MQYVITAHDGAGKLDKRMEVRADHLENLSKIRGKVLCAGGLLDDEGKMAGSVLILDFDDHKYLDEYLDNEPYIKEKVWETVDVSRMNVVFLDGKKVK